MADEMSRVTVVGARRRIDVAVPSWTPVGEYSARLAQLCGQERQDLMPPAWSLAKAGDTAMPLGVSLGDLGVTDGMVLYLRDVAVEPGAPPMVEDLEEIVAEETQRHRRLMMRHGTVLVGLGLAWVAVAAAFSTVRGGGSQSVTVLLTVAALVLLGVAWALQQRGTAVPRPLRLLCALTAVPLLAGAGALVGPMLGGDGVGYRWAGGVAGANLATAMALATTPDAVLFALEIQAVVAALLVPLLMGLDATRTESAATVATLAVGLAALARRTAATVTAWARRLPGRAVNPASAQATNDLVVHTGRLLAVVLAGPTVALLVSLPMLALAGGPVPLILAAVVSLALLARSRQAGFTAELLTYAVTGLVGVFAALLGTARQTHASPVELTALLVGGGLLVVGTGVAATMLAPSEVDGVDAGRPPRRRTTAELVGTLTGIAVVPLTMAVFGVFTHLVHVGRNLF